MILISAILIALILINNISPIFKYILLGSAIILITTNIIYAIKTWNEVSDINKIIFYGMIAGIIIFLVWILFILINSIIG